MSRRVLGVGISLIVAAVLGTGWLAVRRHSLRVALPPITVGVLHSLTGTMAISERSVVDATLLAIEEIALMAFSDLLRLGCSGCGFLAALCCAIELSPFPSVMLFGGITGRALGK